MPWDRRSFELLCSVARPQPDLEQARRILQKGVDGDVLFSLAARHAIRPGLGVLQGPDFAAVWTPRAHKAFEVFQHNHVKQVLALVDALVGIVDAFRTAGIPVATFKGPTLALQLYGDLARREYADIDLLVPHEHLATAIDLLSDLGYRNSQGDALFIRAFLASQRQVALERSDPAVPVDLHWDFSAEGLPFPLAPDSVWPRLETLTIGGRAVPTFAPEEAALLLAGHGTKEAWYRLSWVCDFAWLLERHPGLDWEKLLDRARRRRSGGSLLLAAAMAQRLLQTRLPPELTAPLARSPGIDRTVNRLTAEMREGTGAEPRRHMHDLLLCDRAIDRWKVQAKVLLTPSSGDYHALPLPRPLWPFYWVTRPFRLAVKALRGT